MKLDVAFVNNNLQLGGAETVMQQLHHRLLAAGHRSTIYCDERQSGVKIPRVRGLFPRALNRIYRTRLNRFLEGIMPRTSWTDWEFRRLAHSAHDVVHIHNFHGIYASIESLDYLARRKPVVWTFHRFWGVTGGCDHPGDCRRFLESCGQCPRVNEWPLCGDERTAEELQTKQRVLSPCPMRIIAPSKHLEATVRESRVGGQWEITYLPNGVNLDAYSGARKWDAAFRRRLGLDEELPVVLLVCRNFEDPQKGFSTVKQLFAAGGISRAQFVYAGDRSEYAVRQTPAQLHPVAVPYISDVRQLAEYYEAADILLYSSPRENFPCVVLEAMASECCVVSTPTDGVIEQISHQESGLIAADMSGSALAIELNRALDDATLRRRLGGVAREVVCREFGEELFYERHLAVYEEVKAKWRLGN